MLQEEETHISDIPQQGLRRIIDVEQGHSTRPLQEQRSDDQQQLQVPEQYTELVISIPCTIESACGWKYIAAAATCMY